MPTLLTPEQLAELQKLGAQGIQQLIQLQKTLLGTRTDLKRLFPSLK